MKQVGWLVGLLCSLLAVSVRSEDGQPFFVAPIVSELQRERTSATADAYALVDIDILEFEAGKPQLAPLLESGLESQLASLPTKRYLYMVTHSHIGKQVKAEELKLIKEALREVAKKSGFEKVSVIETNTSETWNDRVGAAVKFAEADEVREDVIENDYVRVYPIRTKLSKLLAGDGDCIVEIFRPIDGTFKELADPLRHAIIDAVTEAKLDQKTRLILDLQSTQGGRDTLEKVFSSRERPVLRDANDPFWVEVFQEQMKNFTPTPALLLAEELGFRSIRYTHSPGGGQPEDLLGKEVPGFTLPLVDAGEFDLRAATKGVPTVITFWGLACGPCRQEAPHLSKIQTQYGPQKLRVVAVNAYNDKQSDVAKYVEQDGLAHTFVLNGRTLAEEVYRVGAYPTTFFVDASGRVVSYEVGFFSEKRLQRQVEKLLMQSEAASGLESNPPR